MSDSVTATERWAARGVKWTSYLVLFFLIAPLLVALPLSFNAEPFFTYPMSDLSLRWYAEFVADTARGDAWRLAFRNSLIIALAASALATLLGTLAALGLQQARFRGKATLQATLLSPMIVPIIVYATGVTYFFAELSLLGTYTGLIIAHAILGTPFVVITVSAALAGFDTNLIRAGLSLGATPVSVFRKVILPLIAPGVASGAVFAFVTSWDEVVVALFVAFPQQQTLPRRLWAGVNEELSPIVIAASAILLLTTFALLLVSEWIRRRGQRLQT